MPNRVVSKTINCWSHFHPKRLRNGKNALGRVRFQLFYSPVDSLKILDICKIPNWISSWDGWDRELESTFRGSDSDRRKIIIESFWSDYSPANTFWAFFASVANFCLPALISDTEKLPSFAMEIIRQVAWNLRGFKDKFCRPIKWWFELENFLEDIKVFG